MGRMGMDGKEFRRKGNNGEGGRNKERSDGSYTERCGKGIGAMIQ